MDLSVRFIGRQGFHSEQAGPVLENQNTKYQRVNGRSLHQNTKYQRVNGQSPTSKYKVLKSERAEPYIRDVQLVCLDTHSGMCSTHTWPPLGAHHPSSSAIACVLSDIYHRLLAMKLQVKLSKCFPRKGIDGCVHCQNLMATMVCLGVLISWGSHRKSWRWLVNKSRKICSQTTIKVD